VDTALLQTGDVLKVLPGANFPAGGLLRTNTRPTFNTSTSSFARLYERAVEN